MKRLIALLFFMLMPVGVAQAVLTIEICGSSTYTCSEPSEITSASHPGGAYFGCNPYDPTDGCNQTNSVDVKINPKSPLDTPPGWTAPVAPSMAPTPPSSQSLPPSTHKYTGGDSYNCLNTAGTFTAGTCRLYDDYSSAMEAVRAAKGWGAWSTSPVLFSGDPANFNALYRGVATNGGAVYGTQGTQSGTCPVGYTSNGSSCVLSNAALVSKPSNGHCTVVRTGNSFAGDSLDPDCAVTPGVTVTPSKVTVQPQKSTPTKTEITVNGDGTVSIVHTTVNADGSTTTRTIAGSAPNGTTGRVDATGTSETKSTGSGTLAGTGNANGTLDMPTDYNRESTQSSVKTGIDALNAKLDMTGVDASLTAQKADLDSAASSHIGAIQNSTSVTDSGLGMTVDMPPSACSDLSYAIPHTGGRALSVPWCDKQSQIKTVLAFVLALSTALYLFHLGCRVFDRS